MAVIVPLTIVWGCGGYSSGDVCGAGTHDEHGVCVAGGSDAGADGDDGSPSNNDSGIHWDGKPLPDVVYGSINGRSVTGVNVKLGHSSYGDYQLGITVVLSNSDKLCAEGTDHVDANETKLTISILEKFPDAARRVVPGTMPVSDPVALASMRDDVVATGIFSYNSGNGACNSYIETQESAVGGSVTVFQLEGDQVGQPTAFVAAFDLQFAMGHLYGSFTGQVCPSRQPMVCP